jgi:hypothetical protein
VSSTILNIYLHIYNMCFASTLESRLVTVLRNDSVLDRMTIIRPLLQFTPIVLNNAVYKEGYEEKDKLHKVHNFTHRVGR